MQNRRRAARLLYLAAASQFLKLLLLTVWLSEAIRGGVESQMLHLCRNHLAAPPLTRRPVWCRHPSAS